MDGRMDILLPCSSAPNSEDPSYQPARRRQDSFIWRQDFHIEGEVIMSLRWSGFCY